MKHFLQVAFADLPIHGINTGGVDTNQYFSLTRMRLRGVFVYEDFRTAVRIDADCFHGFHYLDLYWYAQNPCATLNCRRSFILFPRNEAVSNSVTVILFAWDATSDEHTAHHFCAECQSVEYN